MNQKTEEIKRITESNMESKNGYLILRRGKKSKTASG